MAENYIFSGSKEDLVRLLANMIDEGIRQGNFGTYEDWQNEIERELTENEAADSASSKVAK